MVTLKFRTIELFRLSSRLLLVALPLMSCTCHARKFLAPNCHIESSKFPTLGTCFNVAMIDKTIEARTKSWPGCSGNAKDKKNRCSSLSAFCIAQPRKIASHYDVNVVFRASKMLGSVRAGINRRVQGGGAATGVEKCSIKHDKRFPNCVFRVVYYISLHPCGGKYIGQTRRCLDTRLGENS